MPEHATVTVVAGLTTGVGTVPGANMGSRASVFEQGVRHTAQDIACKDSVNPTGILLAASMMLRHIGLNENANCLDSALYRVLMVRTMNYCNCRRL